jgi:hypothetical protein
VLEQCAAVIFRVDKRWCGVGLSVAAHFSFKRSSRKEIMPGSAAAGGNFSFRSVSELHRAVKFSHV